MANYKIVHRGPGSGNKREVRVLGTSEATPDGFTQLVASAALTPNDNKALFHLVRDELYKIGVHNTQDLIIAIGAATPAVDAFIWEEEAVVEVDGTYAIQVHSLPTNYTDQTVTAVSSATAVATVAVTDNTVTVTAVAIGVSDVKVTVNGKAKTIKIRVIEKLDQTPADDPVEEE